MNGWMWGRIDFGGGQLGNGWDALLIREGERCAIGWGGDGVQGKRWRIESRRSRVCAERALGEEEEEGDER